jgi:hypothetical protein
MTEIKIEIGDNLKEVMLAVLEATASNREPTDSIRPAVVIREAFNLDFAKILKNLGKKVKIIEREIE